MGLGDNSDGELGIGLQNVRHGKTRMGNLDGLNDQVRWNQKFLNSQLLGGLVCFLSFGMFWAWGFNMTAPVKYGVTALTIGMLFLYLAIKVLQRKRLADLRDQQLEKFRENKHK